MKKETFNPYGRLSALTPEQKADLDEARDRADAEWFESRGMITGFPISHPALAGLRAEDERQVMTGWFEGEVQTVNLEVPCDARQADNPFLRLFGSLRHDPTFDDWQAAIAESRREENEAEGIFPERNG
jgi:hypothetical protein